jgi:two-component system, chemotaxis family, protein-glutamate methylesterase/glutaminase
LPAAVAEEGRHLLVGRDHVHVRCGSRENQARPAIDPLFRSAAVNGSSRVIGVVLSGRLNDGTSGLRACPQQRCGRRAAGDLSAALSRHR